MFVPIQYRRALLIEVENFVVENLKQSVKPSGFVDYKASYERLLHALDEEINETYK